MDIFVNGREADNNERVVKAILRDFRPLYGKFLHDSDVLHVNEMFERVDLVREMIKAARVRAVAFHDIRDGALLLIAVQAVKEVRESLNADILAIYVQRTTPSVGVTYINEAGEETAMPTGEHSFNLNK